MASVGWCNNDLARATDIARSMVTEYGMNDKIGDVYLARAKKGTFEMFPQAASGYSEATAELIDSEMRQIISEQYAKALEILKGKKPVPEKAAGLLLEKEKIDGKELNALMAAVE